MVTTPSPHNEAWRRSWTSVDRSMITVGKGLSPLRAKPFPESATIIIIMTPMNYFSCEVTKTQLAIFLYAISNKPF